MTAADGSVYVNSPMEAGRAVPKSGRPDEIGTRRALRRASDRYDRVPTWRGTPPSLPSPPASVGPVRLPRVIVCRPRVRGSGGRGMPGPCPGAGAGRQGSAEVTRGHQGSVGSPGSTYRRRPGSARAPPTPRPSLSRRFAAHAGRSSDSVRLIRVSVIG